MRAEKEKIDIWNIFDTPKFKISYVLALPKGGEGFMEVEQFVYFVRHPLCMVPYITVTVPCNWISEQLTTSHISYPI